MDTYEILALVAVTNFAGYGLAWAAVNQWGYRGETAGEISWWLRSKWESLPELVNVLLFMVMTPILLILGFLVMPVLGLWGLVIGFEHALKNNN